MLNLKEQDFIQYLTVRKHLSPRSVRMYLVRFRIITKWLASEKKELTKETVETFLYQLNSKGLKNRSISTYIHTLRHIDKYCKDRDLPYGFMDEIENLKKTRSEIVILSIEEVERLITTRLSYSNRNGVDNSDLDTKYLTFTSFLAMTGCRFEEAASLQVKRIDIENGRAYLVNTKNGDNRYVYFRGPIKNYLRRLTSGKKDDELVFTNGKGKHLYPTDFGDNLKKRALAAGIKKRVHPHILRHSFATHFYEATHDIAMVATLIGHRDIQTTFDTYVHLADETIKKSSMKHPLMRNYIDISERLKEVKSIIESLKLEATGRFKVNYIETNASLKIEITTISENQTAQFPF